MLAKSLRGFAWKQPNPVQTERVSSEEPLTDEFAIFCDGSLTRLRVRQLQLRAILNSFPSDKIQYLHEKLYHNCFMSVSCAK